MPDVLGLTFDPLAENPYPFYARARQEEPIMFCPDLNAWIVTRYKDIQKILLQPAVFSSCDTLASPVKFYPRSLEELIKGYLPVPIVLNTDGPDHVRFRVPLTRAFAPARIKALEPFVQEVANRLVDAFIDNSRVFLAERLSEASHDSGVVARNGRVEIISQFAYPLALEVVFSLLGIPRKDIVQTRQWSQDWLMLMSIQLEEERQVEYARGTVDFQQYLVSLIAERRENPQDDLISTLLHFSVPDEEPITENELVILLQGLILAGHESTTNMIGTGLLLLLEHPEHWQWLLEHPEGIPQTVEEILRFDAPIQMFARTTTREVTIDGVTLPEEASLLLIYGSGNRDEEAFPDADKFQPQRTSNRHLAFGHGVHFCVGAALARLEGRIAFEVLASRLPGLRLVPGQELTHIPTLLFRGYERLEVEW